LKRIARSTRHHHSVLDAWEKFFSGRVGPGGSRIGPDRVV
jgi:hypothetical protein